MSSPNSEPYDDKNYPTSHPPLTRAPTPPPAEPRFEYPGPPVPLETVYPPSLELIPQLPSLPCGQRKPIWAEDPRIPYTLTTHIVPAAHWREDPDVELPTIPDSISKDKRLQLAIEADEQLRRMRREKDQDKGKKGQKKVLWLVLNRYIRTVETGRDGLTLFCAHANGFNKEIWEPTLVSLLSSRTVQSSVQEIWAWDAVNHGDSALLNASRLNALFHWRNAARDLLTFFTHYLPTTVAGSLPTHLPRVSEEEIVKRLKYGFYDPAKSRKTRTIVGIGHSFGGCASTLAAISLPPSLSSNFFSLLILIDPIILSPNNDNHLTSLSNGHPFAVGALTRRSEWPSRSTAKEAFLKSPFFQRWDPRVLELYIESALFVSSEKQVKLKMPPLLEAVNFSETPTGSLEAWVRLWRGELSKSVELRWVVPGVGQTVLGPGGPSETRTRVWLRPANAKNVRIAGAGHLIPHERPNELGEVIGKWIMEYLESSGKTKL
ncbi:toxin biosynthesis protein [Moniliophthora roreri MCA 2997]|uniref:Toxin biosynthesis protein n=2 Tax=Moniliophthora roreri TaxID=221103 RepID=V2YJ13_MONRO|nr:toxin biosynthesis protein [Moniliophthora roreri MCA 2997]